MSAAIVLPPGLPTNVAWWYHQDNSGISVAAARGAARAASGDWTSGTQLERAADFRASLVARSWVSAKLAGTTQSPAEGPGPLVIAADSPAVSDGDSYAKNSRARAACLLGQTPVILANAVPGFAGWVPPRLMVTGDAPETSFPPLIIVAIIAVSAAVAAVAVAYCSNQAAQVTDNYLARDQALRELVQADAQTLAVLDRHVAREQAAGTTLPLDDVTVRALDSLEARQASAEKRAAGTPPVKSQLPGLPDWGVPAIALGAVAIAAVFLTR